jgi:hypothetical protein
MLRKFPEIPEWRSTCRLTAYVWWRQLVHGHRLTARIATSIQPNFATGSFRGPKAPAVSRDGKKFGLSTRACWRLLDAPDEDSPSPFAITEKQTVTQSKMILSLVVDNNPFLLPPRTLAQRPKSRRFWLL